MWCVHYFLEDIEMQPQVMQALESAYVWDGGNYGLHYLNRKAGFACVI